MTWSKKLDSRAYDPIGLCTLTTAAGSVSSIVVHEATYTVVNDYFCMFNVRINFSQDVVPSIDYYITPPLQMMSADYEPIGHGRCYTAYGGAQNTEVSVERDGSNQLFIMRTAVQIYGAGNDLKIFGHYPIR